MIDPNEPGQHNRVEIDAVTAEHGDAATLPMQAEAQEKALVKQWFERIEKVRKFDDEARKQYARDRRYARGDSGFKVSVNLIGTYIDIMCSFLYAKDPDMDALPAQSATPPTMEAMVEAAIEEVRQGMQGIGGVGGAGIEQMADEAIREAVKQRYEKIKQEYEKRNRDNKAFGETLEIVVSKLWEIAGLKRHAKRWVRSAQTTSVGWLKAGWITRTEPDPTVQHTATDAQASQARTQALADTSHEGTTQPDDLTAANIAAAAGGIAAHQLAECVVSRGFCIELAQPENMTVDPGVALVDYLDARWMTERSFMLRTDAQAYYVISADKMTKAVRWSPRKPVIMGDETAFDADTIRPEDADAFVSGVGGDGLATDADSPDMDYVHLEEIHDRANGVVMVGIEGLDFWAQKPYTPDATKRFFPYFNLTLGEVDGNRHAQSKVTRSYKLQDEYNRVRDAFAEHRRRIKPKMMFNKSLVSVSNASAVVKGVSVEYIGVEPTDQTVPLQSLFYPVSYPQIDPALYETGSIIAELEKIWGVQEALTQAVQVKKTATEANIEQTGFQARAGSDHDQIDDAMTELAIYSAEVALIHMSDDDARAFAGTNAFWPAGMSSQQLPGLLDVSIRAGSTGKPDNALQRQQWSTELPLLQGLVGQIGQLRRSSPAEMADRYEALLEETFARAGDHEDPSRFIPQASPDVAGQGPAPPQPGLPAQGAPATPGSGIPLQPLTTVAPPTQM